MFAFVFCSMKWIADHFDVPYSTLQVRCSGKVTSIGFASGGKGKSKALTGRTEGEPGKGLKGFM